MATQKASSGGGSTTRGRGGRRSSSSRSRGKSKKAPGYTGSSRRRGTAGTIKYDVQKKGEKVRVIKKGETYRSSTGAVLVKGSAVGGGTDRTAKQVQATQVRQAAIADEQTRLSRGMQEAQRALQAAEARKTADVARGGEAQAVQRGTSAQVAAASAQVKQMQDAAQYKTPVSERTKRIQEVIRESKQYRPSVRTGLFTTSLTAVVGVDDKPLTKEEDMARRVRESRLEFGLPPEGDATLAEKYTKPTSESIPQSDALPDGRQMKDVVALASTSAEARARVQQMQTIAQYEDVNKEFRERVGTGLTVLTSAETLKAFASKKYAETFEPVKAGAYAKEYEDAMAGRRAEFESMLYDKETGLPRKGGLAKAGVSIALESPVTDAVLLGAGIGALSVAAKTTGKYVAKGLTTEAAKEAAKREALKTAAKETGGKLLTKEVAKSYAKSGALKTVGAIGTGLSYVPPLIGAAAVGYIARDITPSAYSIGEGKFKIEGQSRDFPEAFGKSVVYAVELPGAIGGFVAGKSALKPISKKLLPPIKEGELGGGGGVLEQLTTKYGLPESPPVETTYRIPSIRLTETGRQTSAWRSGKPEVFGGGRGGIGQTKLPVSKGFAPEITQGTGYIEPFAGLYGGELPTIDWGIHKSELDVGGGIEKPEIEIGDMYKDDIGQKTPDTVLPGETEQQFKKRTQNEYIKGFGAPTKNENVIINEWGRGTRTKNEFVRGNEFVNDVAVVFETPPENVFEYKYDYPLEYLTRTKRPLEYPQKIRAPAIPPFYIGLGGGGGGGGSPKWRRKYQRYRINPVVDPFTTKVKSVTHATDSPYSIGFGDDDGDGFSMVGKVGGKTKKQKKIKKSKKGKNGKKGKKGKNVSDAMWGELPWKK